MSKSVPLATQANPVAVADTPALLANAHAGHSQEILPTPSEILMLRDGQGFSASSLWRMVQFAEAFADFKIVSTLSRQLAWRHFLEPIPLKAPVQHRQSQMSWRSSAPEVTA